MQETAKKTILIFGVVLLLITGLHYWGTLQWFEEWGVRMLNPLIHFLYKQKVNVRSITGTPDELIARVEELEGTLNQLKYLEVTSAELLRENEELKKQLNFFQQFKQYRWATCNVVGKTIDDQTNGIIIDCGGVQAVRLGQAVVAGEGILVGKVVEVQERMAIVRLLNDSKSRVAVSVLNRAQSIGVVEGGFGISVQLTHVPQSEELKENDMIITSGLEDAIPRGLIIGSLETIAKESYQPFQRGAVHQPVDYQKLLIVSVITEESL